MSRPSILYSKLATAAGAVTLVVALQKFLKWRAANSSLTIQSTYPRPPSGPAAWLTDEEYSVLVAVCDTFAPALSEQEVEAGIAALDLPAHMNSDPDFAEKNMAILQAGALNRGVPGKVLELIGHACSETEKGDLKKLLRLLSCSAGCLALTGTPIPFQVLSLKYRVRGMYRLMHSFVPDLRVAYQTLKRLAMSVFMDTITESEWNMFDYNPTETMSKPLRVVDTHSALPGPIIPRGLRDTDIWTVDSADVVIVGSGAGGGVMASELVKAGVHVLVLEKGGYYRSDDFKRWRQGEAQTKLFDKAAFCASKTGSIAVLAGSCVGGGTTLNWTASFRTPAHVLADWAATGLSQFAPGGSFETSLDAVHKLVNVNSKFSYREENSCSISEDDPHFVVNGNNRALWEGAKACGFAPERIPRNVKACVDCGHCSFGCAYNSKQSTLTALMEPLGASELLRLLPHATVSTVHRGSDGVATGVEGFVNDTATGRRIRFRVNAKIVVVSAGALHTPALLLRSGFANRKIGKHLTLHPVVGCAGLSTEPTGLQSGVAMGVVVKGHPALELPSDPGYGVAVETPPVNLNMMGLISKWDTGLFFKCYSLFWKNLLVYINISRDHSKESNRIALDKDGNFEIHYDVTAQDEANMMNGLIQALRIMRKTPGNRLVELSHETMKTFTDFRNDEAFEAYINEVKAGGLARGQFNVFSAHQMGSCRMAAKPEEGPVSPRGSLFECQNVFVADASLFPTSLGVNPMITVEALSHMVSRNVMKQLGVKPGASAW